MDERNQLAQRYEDLVASAARENASIRKKELAVQLLSKKPQMIALRSSLEERRIGFKSDYYQLTFPCLGDQAVSYDKLVSDFADLIRYLSPIFASWNSH